MYYFLLTLEPHFILAPHFPFLFITIKVFWDRVHFSYY
uniref:Uncharacterized protein n=1 Tax=Podoviridae sp. ct8Lf7 TaxID=2827723 RepID=A0A8S5RZW0_9CAUD|nr:MAG TPA: hypothetical protein [Podoviridae sp. ct8Lf7]